MSDIEVFGSIRAAAICIDGLILRLRYIIIDIDLFCRYCSSENASAMAACLGHIGSTRFRSRYSPVASSADSFVASSGFPSAYFATERELHFPSCPQ